ncbi:unnamed protein product [Rotaria magnacalcarata]|uniref:Uncharacterized protein n=1 Tax=Rotaria magnacalcarata TaxID=392030 RepID=A0A820PXF4_9BILA|nr:unnamed protein product [Rotaria magnacalcarata]CAF1618971.1 unnamed protein product [Rotaria magnacalcarata]CAF2084599.1 unnamed protein product [Rotaria magnacalcarata]CAF2248328.1 unnamed protein product [Rotaria magnacalcarata]CAF2262037.1 unnamed protein product [Rotaria magnacalcarata]
MSTESKLSATSTPASSNKGEQIISSPSSTSKFYHRPSNELRHLESIWNDTNAYGVQAQVYRTPIQGVQFINRMQHVHINPDPNVYVRPLLPNISSSNTITLQHEVSAEDRLIERFKDTINEFHNRPYREYSYDTNIYWNIEHCHEIRFNVIISIRKP